MSDIIIGTRGSRLALWQANYIRDQIGEADLKIITSRGDRLVDLPLQSNLEKGLFTKELEVALAAGEVDLAVHSLKDLPVDAPEGLAMGPVPPRAPVADLLLMRRGADPSAPGLSIGSSSARRVAMIAACFTDATVVPIRGNIPTRVNKLREGQADALVLAEAGLHRLQLDLSDLLVFRLDPRCWVPAPGQGALGLQVRDGDARVEGRLAPMSCEDSATAVNMERAVLSRFGGGCHAALGAYGEKTENGWTLHIGAANGNRFDVASLPIDDPNPAHVDDWITRFKACAEPLTELAASPWTP